MSTTPPPPVANQNYALNVGGSLVIPPQPDVVTYALRPDQFQTLVDGEMSVSRSIRDACIGALATGITGIGAILLTIDWDLAEKQGRHPVPWLICLCTLTAVALLYCVAESIRMYRTKTGSAYSRLVQTIKQYFGLA